MALRSGQRMECASPVGTTRHRTPVNCLKSGLTVYTSSQDCLQPITDNSTDCLLSSTDCVQPSTDCLKPTVLKIEAETDPEEEDDGFEERPEE